ncbi:MAG: LTA synthase family protein [Armatimonadetes bacterium]|nr:LTA synthase family protein [Armatimonadota bacterium]
MRTKCIVSKGLVVVLLLMAVCGGAIAAQTKTKNIIFITADGLRWEEVFHGADRGLLSKEGGVADQAAADKKYWRETATERRKAVLPFLWTEVAQKGQIFGNRDLGSASRVENPYWFSFPGYSEMLCGFVDESVNSNNLVNNPNVSVLEWLHRKPAFKNKVAAFGAWDALPYILNRDRAGFVINGGLDPVNGGKISERQYFLNALKTETVDLNPGAPPDSIMFYSALEYFKQNKPRVIYIMLGWTDVAAHRGRYDEYLKAARLYDEYVRKIWNTAQSMPEYKGNTTLIMTTDHGRGEVGDGWKSHSTNLPGSEKTWMAYMGPDTPALGERSNVDEVTNSQFAATLAALLGEDYNAAQPKAGKVVQDVVKGK